MKIIFIRHGKTQGNLEKRYIGKTDEPLCQTGIEELENNVKTGKYPSADQIFTSPMIRCRQTKKIIYGDEEFFLITEFSEMDFGDFEGKNYEQLNGNPEYQAWIDSNGTLPFPNGEGRDDFEKRSMDGFDRLLKLADEKKAHTVAAIVHGGTIMAILSNLGFGSYFDFQIKNGDGYIVDLEKKTCCSI